MSELFIDNLLDTRKELKQEVRALRRTCIQKHTHIQALEKLLKFYREFASAHTYTGNQYYVSKAKEAEQEYSNHLKGETNGTDTNDNRDST